MRRLNVDRVMITALAALFLPTFTYGINQVASRVDERREEAALICMLGAEHDYKLRQAADKSHIVMSSVKSVADFGLEGVVQKHETLHHRTNNDYQRTIDNLKPYSGLISSLAKDTGLPENLIYATIHQESKGVHRYSNGKVKIGKLDDRGFGQLRDCASGEVKRQADLGDKTLQKIIEPIDFSHGDPRDFEESNLRFTAGYLLICYRQAHGNLRLTAAKYNQGPRGLVNRYVQNVMRHYDKFNNSCTADHKLYRSAETNARTVQRTRVSQYHRNRVR